MIDSRSNAKPNMLFFFCSASIDAVVDTSEHAWQAKAFFFELFAFRPSPFVMWRHLYVTSLTHTGLPRSAAPLSCHRGEAKGIRNTGGAGAAETRSFRSVTALLKIIRIKLTNSSWCADSHRWCETDTESVFERCKNQPRGFLQRQKN